MHVQTVCDSSANSDTIRRSGEEKKHERKHVETIWCANKNQTKNIISCDVCVWFHEALSAVSVSFICCCCFIIIFAFYLRL